jgi:glyoxylase I family protein
MYAGTRQCCRKQPIGVAGAELLLSGRAPARAMGRQAGRAEQPSAGSVAPSIAHAAEKLNGGNMPNVQNALAGIAVEDLDVAARWYEKLLARVADTRPMPELLEWRFERGGWLQVFSDVQRAGSCSVTLVIDDFDATLRELQAKGIDVDAINRNPKVDTAILHDPEGNQVVLARTHTSEMAS